MLATAGLTSSKAGLPNWSSVSPSSTPAANPVWPDLPDELAAALSQVDPAAIGAALNSGIAGAASDFADGVALYRRHPYHRADDMGLAVWRAGGTALLDHGTHGGVPALFVPSLVNRGWVLDLVPGAGMLSWLAGQGVHPYRIEWGPPGEAERAFAIEDYVRLRLEPALDEVARRSGRKPILVGYCMGGLLALAAAVRRPEAIGGLVLLATPWDFHADEARGRAEAIGAFYRLARPLLAALGEFPIDLIQALFAMHDPIVALRKFRRFAHLDMASEAARNFVALEDWLNDGVALTLPVADEAMQSWYGDNAPGNGAWAVGSARIDPAAISVPALVVVPGGDRLVPPASAAAVLPHMKQAERLDLPLGHIGMVVGRNARRSLWTPLAEWLLTRA